MNNTTTNQLQSLWGNFNDEQKRMFMDSAVRCFFAAGVNPSSGKAVDPNYSARPILPDSMTNVAEKTFGVSSPTSPTAEVKTKSGRFCPSWYERSFRNDDILIHKYTGAVFGLTNEEMSQGGWIHIGWVTDKDYPGHVKVDPVLLARAKTGTDSQLSSFNKFHHLVHPGNRESNGYNASEFWSPKHRKSLAQINYSCKKRHDLTIKSAGQPISK